MSKTQPDSNAKDPVLVTPGLCYEGYGVVPPVLFFPNRAFAPFLSLKDKARMLIFASGFLTKKVSNGVKAYHFLSKDTTWPNAYT